mmetsp:Transcript_45859/g.106602  ORF Transcript_45859/g.106602 Transcript_45859/m.106602 type:complete len:572 (+) Transcript_45859:47-1762(+)
MAEDDFPSDVEGLRTLRKQISIELSGMLESLPVKMLKDFRTPEEVNKATEAAAVAASCLVSGIESSLEVPGNQPPQTWHAVQLAMSKPGHFISALRRFPYAVDGGRLPAANAAAAESMIKDVNADAIGDDPVAKLLCRWVRLALRYCRVRDQLLTVDPVASQAAVPASPVKGDAASPESNSPVGPLAQAKLEPFSGSKSPDSPPSAPISGITARLVAAGLLRGSSTTPDRAPPPAQAASDKLYSAASPPPAPAASSGARPSSAAEASPARSGKGNATTPSTRPERRPASAGVAPKRTSQPKQAELQQLPARKPVLPRQARGVAQNKSPLAASRGGVATQSKVKSKQPLDRPHGPLQRVSSADLLNADALKAKVEQLRRETREMKAAENTMKWSMRREERQVKREEKVRESKDIMAWRREQADEAQAYEDETNRFRLQAELAENRDYQEFKRDRKEVLREEDLQDIKERYEDDKEYSEWFAAQKRELPLEEQASKVEANIENFRTMQEYQYEEERLRKMEEIEAIQQEQQGQMKLLIHQARQEHDAAQRSLESVQRYGHHPVNVGSHLLGKP